MTDQKAVARVEKLEGRKYLPYQVKIGSQSIWMELSSKNSAQILADQINAGISQTHVPRSEAEALRERLEEVKSANWSAVQKLASVIREMDDLRRVAGEMKATLERVDARLSIALTSMERDSNYGRISDIRREAQEVVAAFDQIEKESGNRK